MNHAFTLLTGASAGIGKEMAVVCAKKGLNLLLVSLPNSELAEFAKELKEKFNVQVDYFEANLGEQKTPEAVYNWCIEKGYQVNALINNVGAGGSERFEDLTSSDIQAMIHLNTYVISSLTNLFIPMLKQQEKAYILNVSSTASYFNIPNKALYAATKSFVNTLTTSLRNELAHTNISLSLLCPGGSSHKKDANVERRLHKVFVNLVHKTPESIAKAGVEGMLKEKRLILPGVASKLYVSVAKILPVTFADLVVNKLFQSSSTEAGRASPRRPVHYRWLPVALGVIVIAAIALTFSSGPTFNTTHTPDRLFKSEQHLVFSDDPSISAFTALDNLNIAFTRNNENAIYVYNKETGKTVDKIVFSDKGEFKGLAYNRGYFYLLRSDGCIVSIHEKGADYSMAAYETPLDQSDNLEGLYIDTVHHRLLIDVQGGKSEDDDKNGMYGFDLVNKTFINSGAVFFLNKN
jgi:short-subunit dehydrogenase